MYATNITTSHSRSKKNRRALKLIAGTTAIAVLASACGSDNDASTTGEAQTGAADDSTSLVPDAPEDDSISEFSLADIAEGGWTDNFGAAVLSLDGSMLQYEYSGGALDSSTLDAATRTVSGVWVQETSPQECESEVAGSAHWGQFNWVFSPDGTSFEGTWAYCDDDLGGDWSGRSNTAASSGDSAVGSDAGILVDDRPTRFFELDWQIVGSQRRPDGPTDDGVDTDPTQDFVYVDIDVTSPLEDASISIPVEWLSLVDAEGQSVRPVSASDRESGSRISTFIDARPNRTVRLTAVFAVDASDSFDGGWVELDQDGYLSAALAGPAQTDEAARLPVSFGTTTYSGPYSRDAATIEILEAAWSRELGLEDDGFFIESPYNFSRRPPVESAWLLVHFELTCERTGGDTGGCNVGGGQVVVDGQAVDGSAINGRTSYDATDDYWAAYPVPIDAKSVVVEIASRGGLEDGGKTSFVVTDLAPLQLLATST